MLTLGVAGHVDHGKTSLVRALTGMETDRLPEEQRRGISIELGFAWLDVADLGQVALIDMPGHERFVRRMIAGATGIDALLLVVAADEGVMPQGREHLAIARLLGIRRGAVILTKTDLCDAEMLALALEDVQQLTLGSFLQGAPVLAVSARQAETVAALRAELAALCKAWAGDRERENDAGQRPFRLAVDRAFSLHGRGTIVAGTAVTGQVELEQMLQVLPQQQTFRVRGLERHGQPTTRLQAPGRVAINLAGATLDDVPIGSVLATPGATAISARFDAELTLLAHCRPWPVRRRAAIQIGTATSECAIVLLAGTPLQPGHTAPAQIRLDCALPLVAGEGFVLRGSRLDPRHGQTLGGGRVLHPLALRHRVGDPAVLAALAALAEPDAARQVRAAVALAQGRGVADDELPRLCAAPPAALQKAARALGEQKLLVRLGTPARWLDAAAVQTLHEALTTAVRAFHGQQPTRAGAELPDLQRALAPWLEATVFAQIAALAVRQGRLRAVGTGVALPDFAPKATASPELVAALMALVTAQGLAPETPAQWAAHLGTDGRSLMAALQLAQAAGQVARIAEDYWVAQTAADEAKSRVLATFVAVPAFGTGALKELLGLTRKHLIPFAEYLDAERITVRDPGGNRQIRERARAAWLAAQAERSPADGR